MIFLVEDDEATRDAIQLLLECESLAVQGFASCDALLREADPKGADCIVLDVHMEGTTGIELLERLKRVDGAPPVILMTGNLTPDIGARARAAGALAVLEKPFRGNELVDLVTRAVGERR